MQDFQQRVVDEKTDLDGKVTRLSDFFGGSVFQSLPKEEHVRLEEQITVMQRYSYILGERIKAFV